MLQVAFTIENMTGEETIGQRIKRLREEHDWTYRALVERIRLHGKAEVSAGYLSLVESGARHPKRERLTAIAAGFGLSYLELVRGIPRLDDSLSKAGSGEGEREMRRIHSNLLTIRELNPDELARVAVVVEAMAADLMRRRGEEGRDFYDAVEPSDETGPADSGA